MEYFAETPNSLNYTRFAKVVKDRLLHVTFTLDKEFNKCKIRLIYFCLMREGTNGFGRLSQMESYLKKSPNKKLIFSSL